VTDKEEEVKPKKKRAPRKKPAEAPPAETEMTDAAPEKGGVLVIVESRPKRKRSASIWARLHRQGDHRPFARPAERELGVDVETTSHRST